MTDRPGLPMWTIYDHPRDFPHCWVARLFIWDKPTEDILTAPTLEALQAHFYELGLYRMERQEGDDAKIVEIWI
jgi:hypothetical protein